MQFVTILPTALQSRHSWGQGRSQSLQVSAAGPGNLEHFSIHSLGRLSVDVGCWLIIHASLYYSWHAGTIPLTFFFYVSAGNNFTKVPLLSVEPCQYKSVHSSHLILALLFFFSLHFQHTPEFCIQFLCIFPSTEKLKMYYHCACGHAHATVGMWGSDGNSVEPVSPSTFVWHCVTQFPRRTSIY